MSAFTRSRFELGGLFVRESFAARFGWKERIVLATVIVPDISLGKE